MSTLKATTTRFIFAAVAALFCVGSWAGASVDQIPINITYTPPDCPGAEPIKLSGELQILSHPRFDKAGGIHFTWREQLINVVGVGTETGSVYRAVGNVRQWAPDNFSSVNLPAGGTTVLNLVVQNRLFPIAGGEGTGRTVHVVYKLTLNANGELTAEVEKMTISCDEY